MTLSIFNDLPNEIWFNILQFSDHSISTVHKLSMIRPEIFHLYVSGFDVWTDSYETLYFKELYRYQTDRVFTNDSSEGKIAIVEFMKSTLKPNFRKLKPSEVKELANAQYCVFSAVDDLTEDGTSLRMIPSVMQRNRFPKSYQFPLLETLVLHCTKQAVQKFNKSSMFFKLNDDVFPSLKELSFEGNSNTLVLEDVKLTSLRKLQFAGQSLITSIKDIHLPNLEELVMDSGRRFHSHADDIEDLRINENYLSFLDLDTLSVQEQVQRGSISYHNPEFDPILNLPSLKVLELNISLVDIEAIRTPNHLYFLDALPFEQLEELRFQLEDPYIDAESRIANSPSDFILQLTQVKLVQVLSRCSQNLKKLKITSAIGNNFNCDDIIEVLPQLTNLVELEFDTIYASRKFPVIELPHLEVATLKYASYSEFIDIKSTKLTKLDLTFFPFSVNFFNKYAGRVREPSEEPSTVEYMNSFSDNFPALDSLTIDMYTPYWAYKDGYPGQCKPPHIITRRRHLVEACETVNFQQLRSLHLIFNFQELFNFFNTAQNYTNLNNLEKLQLHGWFDDFENTPQFTSDIIKDINRHMESSKASTANGTIQLNLNAPNLKRFIGHFSKQAVIDFDSPLHKTLTNQVKSLQLPSTLTSNLQEIVLGTSHTTFSHIKIPNSIQQQVRIKALKWFSPFKPYVEKMVALGDTRYRGMLDVIWYDEDEQ
ncbi:hypothetical protein WICPIJ_000256 [Wickerhamomyces pijperi]|uniref:F-box domain-containing protein n=1 Tax=Wickerhamomyces pijperi TaxID=599730 RepID=A0A9P8QHI0_WICPI|nr:hypothetical protein WICPIJ_000256 [Wickerhamomyces pijperi]